MGAFLSGLLGAAGKDIEQQEQRAYQEGKEGRDRKRRLVELAGETAIQKGLYNELPSIFSVLDDELGTPPGTPKGIKDPFRQMGAGLAKILHRRKQQQGQQRQQGQQPQTNGVSLPGKVYGGVLYPPGRYPMDEKPEPFPAEYDQYNQRNAPGQSSQPPQTPPMPAPSAPVAAAQQRGGVFARMGPEIAQLEEASEEKKFQTGRKHGDIEAEDATKRQMVKADALTKYLQGQGLDEKKARETADRIVFDKALKPEPLRKVANATSDQFPELGIKGKTGTVYIDPATNKAVDFVETQGRATSADEIAKWSKIIKTAHPKLSQEQAEQLAAKGLEDTKFLLPEKRLQAMYDVVRSIPGEKGVLQIPTRVPGIGRGATPPMPAPSTPVKRAAPGGVVPGTPSQPTPAGRVIQYPPEFTPEIKGTERVRKDNAEVIMTKGGDAIATIEELSRQHPDWFGPMAGRIQDLEKTVGTADPGIGTLKGALNSLIGFLPSLHGFRSAAILKEWKDVLDNPLKNPQYTIATLREVTKAAQELRDTILRRSTESMTAEGEERKAGAGKRPKNPY